MKKINKMMLLSMSAFVPLVTIVACSSKTAEEPKALAASGVAVAPKTVASSLVKMTVKNLPASPDMAKLVLHLVELKTDGAEETTETAKKKVAASVLTGEAAEFKFENVLTASKKYKLVKVEYDGKQTFTFENTDANKFEVEAAAAATS